MYIKLRNSTIFKAFFVLGKVNFSHASTYRNMHIMINNYVVVISTSVYKHGQASVQGSCFARNNKKCLISRQT